MRSTKSCFASWRGYRPSSFEVRGMRDHPRSRCFCDTSAAAKPLLTDTTDLACTLLVQRSDTVSRSIRQRWLKCTPVVAERQMRRSSVLGVAWPQTREPNPEAAALRGRSPQTLILEYLECCHAASRVCNCHDSVTPISLSPQQLLVW